ncbi:MAG: hypothetical protein B6U87_00210 [Candidatus Aenigmarchaeota archaeon ex4484_52]|nr:MAG: hypothetical protein B6U87_00210 [Candidatus Aenigmarchaeota archaeon ex4484_52]
MQSKISAEKDISIDFYCKKIFETLKEIVEKELSKKQTFAVRVKRQGNHIFTSIDIERKIGFLINKFFGNKVNLTKPDKTIFIEIKNNDVWIYTNKIIGLGGLPAGVEGNIICLIRNEKKYFDDDIKAGLNMLVRGAKLYVILIGTKITQNDINFCQKNFRKYDPNIQNKISKIECSNLHIAEFRNELIKKINSTKAKAILLGIKINELDDFCNSAKLLSNRNISIERIPIFTPNLSYEL